MKDQLVGWYDAHKRDLPWRRTSDPYAIWVSEIMLQQTQVATVIPYWQRWMARFPTVESLAKADTQEVLALWQGLGYYRRCRMLLDGAKFVATHGMPRDAAEWRKVPGVGAYTAGAIASIAFQLPAALVDGNVERVVARLTANASTGPALSKAVWQWAEAHIPLDRPGDWNQALMELGATVCTPNAPDCARCPLAGHCVALQQRQQGNLPTKIAKAKPIALSHTVWIPYCKGSFGIRQIAVGLWWEGMWEFLRVDQSEEAKLALSLPNVWPELLGKFSHSVTNHRISVEVFLIRLEEPTDLLLWVPKENIHEYPLPAPQKRCLQMALKHV